MTTEQMLRFWAAAQSRSRREERERLAGLFTAFVDALRWVVVPLWAAKAPRQEQPWYLGPDRSDAPSTRRSAPSTTIEQLARDFAAGEFGFSGGTSQ